MDEIGPAILDRLIRTEMTAAAERIKRAVFEAQGEVRTEHVLADERFRGVGRKVDVYA